MPCLYSLLALCRSKTLRFNWLLTAGLLATLAAQAQTPVWQMAAPATVEPYSSSAVLASVADGNGNVYLAGRFSGTITLGTTSLSSQGSDIFLAKWSPATRDYVWAQRVGGGYNDVPVALAISGSTLYLAGKLGGASADFGNLSISNVTVSPFVARFADTGSEARFAWVWQPAFPFEGEVRALAVSGNSVYLAGAFSSRSVTLGSTVLTNAAPAGFAGNDAFVAKLNDTGSSAAVSWALQAGGSYVDEASSLAVSGSSVYVAGSFNSASINFGSLSLSSAGSADVFVAKITDAATPAFTWAQRAGGVNDDKAAALASNGASVYVTGTFASNAAAFGSTTLALASSGADEDIFVAKLSDAGSTGGFTWALRAGSLSVDDASALVVSGSSLYLTGQFGFTGTFGSTTLPGAVYGDVYVAKLLDAGLSGSFAWAQRGSGNSFDSAHTLAVAGSLVYVGGSVTSPAVFGTHTIPGPTNIPTPLAFLAALHDSPTAPALSRVSPANALPGEIVALSGSNLTGTTTVRFAGSGLTTVSSGFSVNAAGTVITGIVVPAGAATGYLTITTPVGTSNGLPFVVSPTPPAWQTAMSVGPTVGGNAGTTVEAMTTDGAGNVYVAGRLYSSGRFSTITLNSVGAADVFVAKWSPSANRFLWAMRAGGTADDAATAIAVSGNSVYLAGSLESSTATFGSTTLTNAGYTDVFIAKLTDAGSSASFSWVKHGAGAGYERPAALAVSGANVYLVGQASAGFTLSGTPMSSTGGGGVDLFVAKLVDTGPSGSVAWIVGAGGTNNDYVQGVAVNGNQVYIAGHFTGTAVLGSFSLLNASNQTYISDTFVAKLVDAGSSASFVWAQSAGSNSDDGATAIAVSGTSVYIAGSYAGNPSFGTTTLPNAGYDDIFIAKLTDTGTAGSFDWAKTAGGGLSERVTAIAARGSAVYVAGNYFSYTASFGSSMLLNAYTSPGGNSYDIFVTKLLDAGSTASYAWAQRAGGVDHDEAFALALAGNTIYVAGRATGAGAFPPLSFPSVQGQDGAFLASMIETQATATKSGSDDAGFTLYPNPAHHAAHFVLPAAWAATTEGVVVVLNTMGQAVRQQRLSSSPAGTPLKLDLAGLAPGLYLVRVQAGAQFLTRQLLVR
jgi:hypothetical protein